jgi:AcrR family transcriptional regulator
MYSVLCGRREALRRAAILRVARDIFSEVGYAATSMAQIAAKLGGSKATLYKYFPSKQELFAASLEDLISAHASDMLPPVPHDDGLEKSLSELCGKLTTAMLSPPLVALFRLVVAESPRFPELGQAYYDKVVVPGTERLSAFLQQCMDRHLIRVADPTVAARQLAALCRTNLHFKVLASVESAFSPAAIEAEADAAASWFLAAYRLEGPAASRSGVG